MQEVSLPRGFDPGLVEISLLRVNHGTSDEPNEDNARPGHLDSPPPEPSTGRKLTSTWIRVKSFAVPEFSLNIWPTADTFRHDESITIGFEAHAQNARGQQSFAHLKRLSYKITCREIADDDRSVQDNQRSQHLRTYQDHVYAGEVPRSKLGHGMGQFELPADWKANMPPRFTPHRCHINVTATGIDSTRRRQEAAFILRPRHEVSVTITKHQNTAPARSPDDDIISNTTFDVSISVKVENSKPGTSKKRDRGVPTRTFGKLEVRRLTCKTPGCRPGAIVRSLPLVAPDNEKFRVVLPRLGLGRYAVYAYSYQRDIAQPSAT